MTISVSNAAGASVFTPAASGAEQAADESNMFLKLLVTEMQNQDPTKPMDSAQLVQQLAAFSQVQQGAQLNNKLSAMLETLSVGQSAALIGRSLTSSDGEDLGTVEAVRFTDRGLIARLSDGREVVVGQGVTIRA